MTLVVLLHQMLRSGGLASGRKDVFVSYWLIEAAAICAVNVFALISGYVSYRKEPRRRKISSIIELWLMAVFYGLIIALIFKTIMPDKIGWSVVAAQFFPLIRDAHWYLTAYVGLFFLMPLIDIALVNMTKEKTKRVMWAMIIVFSCIASILGIDFRLSGGYGVLWLAIMYFIGGAMKKCEIGFGVKTWKYILGIIVAILISWLWKICAVKIELLHVTPGTLMSYTAPTIVAISMMLVILFSRLQLRSWMERAIIFAVPSVFAIYIINTNQLLWSYVLTWQAQFISNAPLVWLILTSFGFVVGFATLAILIDKVRVFFFKLIHLDKVMKKVDAKIEL